MNLRDEAARRVAEEVDNARRSAAGVKWIRRTLGELRAAGTKLVYGKVITMAFDPTSATPDQAAQTLATVAKALGVDDATDADAITTALDALISAAGLDSGDGAGVDGSVAHEHAQGQGPVMASAVARGRAMLGWK